MSAAANTSVTPIPAITPPDIDPCGVPPSLFPQIAHDIAGCFTSTADAIAKYGLGPPDQDPRTQSLFQNPRFQLLYDQAIDEFAGASDTPKRIRLRAALLVEDNLPVLNEIAKDPNHQYQPRDRLTAITTMAKIAGVEQPPAGAAQEGARFTVNISIPGQTPISVGVDVPIAGAMPQIEGETEEISVGLFGEPL